MTDAFGGRRAEGLFGARARRSQRATSPSCALLSILRGAPPTHLRRNGVPLVLPTWSQGEIQQLDKTK